MLSLRMVELSELFGFGITLIVYIVYCYCVIAGCQTNELEIHRSNFFGSILFILLLCSCVSWMTLKAMIYILELCIKLRIMEILHVD